MEEHKITEEDKMIAREVKRVLKIDDNFVLSEFGLHPDGGKGYGLISTLRKRGRPDLADYLEDFERKYGMKVCDICSELELDEKYSKELKQLEEDLKEIDFK